MKHITRAKWAQQPQQGPLTCTGNAATKIALGWFTRTPSQSKTKQLDNTFLFIKELLVCVSHSKKHRTTTDNSPPSFSSISKNGNTTRSTMNKFVCWQGNAIAPMDRNVCFNKTPKHLLRTKMENNKTAGWHENEPKQTKKRPRKNQPEQSGRCKFNQFVRQPPALLSAKKQISYVSSSKLTFLSMCMSCCECKRSTLQNVG